MVISIFDHRWNGMRDMLGQLRRVHVEEMCQHLGAICGEGKMSQANLVLGHFRYEQIEQILHSTGKATDFPDMQVVVFISAALETYAYVEPNINRVVESYGKKRALLFVRRMSLLENDAVLKDVLGLSFEQAVKIVEEGNALSLGWNGDPFSTSSLPIFEVLPALSILSQAYIAQLAGVKGVRINDEDEPQPPHDQIAADNIARLLGEWPENAACAEGQEHRPDQPGWWDIFGKDFRTEAAREWESLANDDDADAWQLVETLLNAIGGNAPITTAMVAGAYAAIVRRFDAVRTNPVA